MSRSLRAGAAAGWIIIGLLGLVGVVLVLLLWLIGKHIRKKEGF